MSRTQWTLVAIAVASALAIGALLGRALSPDAPALDTGAASQAVRKPLYYRNPMGLPDTSPVPKKDSMGMDYIPVYAEEAASAAPGTVVISPERVQMLGVRTEQVRLRPLERGIQASGTVTVDETRQHVIAPPVRGLGGAPARQSDRHGRAARTAVVDGLQPTVDGRTGGIPHRRCGRATPAHR